MRINKFLAECGIASRRNCEALVLEGRVKVNNKKVLKLATDVDPESDLVSVDDKPVKPIGKHLYIMLNKPKGYVCTTSDELGRKTVMELLKDKYPGKRIFPVGRLDFDTEGLLLLTTDGDLANRLMHPRNEISKTYVAKIEGEISEADLNKLRSGVELDGVKTKKCKVKLLGFDENMSRIEVVITEGRNRQVRRMFESINRDVVFLKRTAIGDIKLGGLYRGNFRELKANESEYLKKI
ncbi:MAG: rRNA pseudouridine synthase [Clostridia bacterium]|nr:rRNA pseudouridine synthase [Clostridia bacterium]MBR6773027.1 rRNA pseudouridine synthase [Clostridia bacterium]